MLAARILGALGLGARMFGTYVLGGRTVVACIVGAAVGGLMGRISGGGGMGIEDEAFRRELALECPERWLGAIIDRGRGGSWYEWCSLCGEDDRLSSTEYSSSSSPSSSSYGSSAKAMARPLSRPSFIPSRYASSRAACIRIVSFN